MNINTTEFYKLRQELKKYAELDGCSLGDYCMLLYHASSYRAEQMSDEFEQALVKEVVDTVSMFKKNTKIVITTETFTRELYELEWY